jgi:hypothetical protein
MHSGMWEFGGRFGGEIDQNPSNRIRTGFEQLETLTGVKQPKTDATDELGSLRSWGRNGGWSSWKTELNDLAVEPHS